MIDIALLREQPDVVRASQRARGERVELVDEAISADSARRAAVAAFDKLRNEQKMLGKDIGPLQGSVKKGDTSKQAELDALMAKASALSEQVAAAEETLRQADAALEAVLKSSPTSCIPMHRSAVKRTSSYLNTSAHRVTSKQRA